METDCNLKKIGQLFFKFSLLSSKNHYKLIVFYSPFKNSLHFFLEFSENYFVDKKMLLVLIYRNFHPKVTKYLLHSPFNLRKAFCTGNT